MNRPTRILSLALGTLASAALLASSALATGTDQVVHPNSSCEWTTDWNVTLGGASTQSNVEAGMSHSDTSGHDDGPSRRLVCGVDRFNITNTDGLRDLDVRLAGGNDSDVTCAATSLRPDGTIVKQLHIYAHFTGTYRIDFNQALNASVAYGAYTVGCYMDPGVSLVNILQREY